MRFVWKSSCVLFIAWTPIEFKIIPMRKPAFQDARHYYAAALFNVPINRLINAWRIENLRGRYRSLEIRKAVTRVSFRRTVKKSMARYGIRLFRFRPDEDRLSLSADSNPYYVSRLLLLWPARYPARTLLLLRRRNRGAPPDYLPDDRSFSLLSRVAERQKQR